MKTSKTHRLLAQLTQQFIKLIVNRYVEKTPRVMLELFVYRKTHELCQNKGGGPFLPDKPQPPTRLHPFFLVFLSLTTSSSFLTPCHSTSTAPPPPAPTPHARLRETWTLRESFREEPQVSLSFSSPVQFPERQETYLVFHNNNVSLSRTSVAVK